MKKLLLILLCVPLLFCCGNEKKHNNTSLENEEETDKELYWEDNDTIIRIQKHYPTGDTIIDTIIKYNNKCFNTYEKTIKLIKN